MYKIAVFATLLAVANAGYLGAPVAAPLAYAAPAAIASPALVSQQSNILRTPGNLGQISTYSKTINTPYSSVSKSDVRVSNDALVHPAPLAYHGYAAPAIHAPVAVAAPALAAPAIARYASPYGVAAPVAVASPAVGVAYSAAPVASHLSFDGLGVHYAY